MKSILIFLIICVTYSNCAPSTTDLEFDLLLDKDFLKEWHEFKEKFNKIYDEEEEFLRRKIFFNTKKFINEHNKKLEQTLEPKPTFSLGINKYSDLSDKEIATKLNGYKKNFKKKSRNFFVPPDNYTIPKNIDWRESGCVTKVKDQRLCGSCWAFSSTGALEGQLCLKQYKKVNLSEQNLVDCSYDNNGCDGGEMETAFEYIHKNNGIDSEESYPYEAIDDKCRYKKKYNQGSDNGFVSIKKGNEIDLKIALAIVGPISIAIDASHISFQEYSGGIYFDNNCNKNYIDHAVLLVGYGYDEKTKNHYWIIKNSWGTTWGENGYMKMLSGKNMCGIAEYASYPVVRKKVLPELKLQK